MCKIDGCRQQTLTGDYCYYHQKVEDGLIVPDVIATVNMDEAVAIFDKYHHLRVGISQRFFRKSPYVGGRFDLKELLQVCHVATWEYLSKNDMRNVQHPVTYLQRLCFYKMVSYVRHENYMPFVSLSSISEKYLDPILDDRMRDLHSDVVLKRLLRFVKRCSKLERNLFHYHVYPTTYKPRTLRWMSKTLGIPLATLAGAKKRLLKKLRRGVR